jgi:hypothetical protein
MEQGLSYEENNCSASRGIPPLLKEPEYLWPYAQRKLTETS